MLLRANLFIALSAALVCAVPALAQSPRLADNQPMVFPTLDVARDIAPSLAVLTFQQQASEQLARGAAAGTSEAEGVGTGGYFAGGLAGGLLLGLIGTGIVYAVAAGSAVDLESSAQARIADESAVYQQGFRDAYTRKVKSKRKQSALVGGLLGTATWVVILLSASS